MNPQKNTGQPTTDAQNSGQQPLRDWDESAFNIDASPSQPAAPIASVNPYTAAPISDILPPQSAQQQLPAPLPPLQPLPSIQPTTQSSPTPTPVATPATPPSPQPSQSFGPPLHPAPQATMDIVSAPPTTTAPGPQQFGAQPAAAASPAILSAPRPIEPTPTNPDMSVQHLSPELAARLSQTPQQNSIDVQHQIEDTQKVNRLKSIVSFLAFVAGILVAAFLINQFLFQSYFVDGTSMTPTLQNNDRLIIEKVGRTFATLQGKDYIPSRGQIVILDSSIIAANGRHEQLIKRVIALPGETVSIRDGVVTVSNADNPDGFNVDVLLGLNLLPTYVSEPLELTVPEGEVFVMGDNRGENGSYDSRAFGPVQSDDLEGRLWARVLPVNEARLFD